MQLLALVRLEYDMNSCSGEMREQIRLWDIVPLDGTAFRVL